LGLVEPYQHFAGDNARLPALKRPAGNPSGKGKEATRPRGTRPAAGDFTGTLDFQCAAAIAGIEPAGSGMGLLSGLRVLVVEDDPVTAIDISDMIERADGEVLGPVKSIKEAGRVAKSEAFDVALLDANLSDGEVTPVLEQLHARKIPMLVYSGASLPPRTAERHPDLRVLTKPVLPAKLLGEIVKAHRGGRI
jgi:CheY-like chemotaxis protein